LDSELTIACCSLHLSVSFGHSDYGFILGDYLQRRAYWGDTITSARSVEFMVGSD
jgi:hypothetical protein